jgi:hypothetical protein
MSERNNILRAIFNVPAQTAAMGNNEEHEQTPVRIFVINFKDKHF